MVTISILSGIFFLLGMLSSLVDIDKYPAPVLMGVVFIVSVWNLSLTLAVIAIVLSVIGGIANIGRNK